jgi:hypothetical protein
MRRPEPHGAALARDTLEPIAVFLPLVEACALPLEQIIPPAHQRQAQRRLNLRRRSCGTHRAGPRQT